ncbi:MAG: neutral/alkaline non-lysosomal ceramidase N-terminal domain-containing protein [Candidatus Asgardarchaeia archaeon]
MGKLKVGVARFDITPPSVFPLGGYGARKDGVGPSVGVHDPLYAKAFVFSDGDGEYAIIANDVIAVDNELFNEACKRVEEVVGIPSSNIIISATHTHSGPLTATKTYYKIPEKYVQMIENYRRFLIDSWVGLVYVAKENMREGSIGIGVGRCEDVGKNRRDPNGPMDPQVGVIRFNDSEGNFLASIVNYSCHPTVLDAKNLLISADFPGYTNKAIEKVKGGVSAFINGTQGNISTRYTRRRSTFDEAERLGNILAGEVLKTVEKLETVEDVEISVASKGVEIPLKETLSVEEAEKLVKEAEKKVEELKKSGASPPDIRTAITALEGANIELSIARMGLKPEELDRKFTMTAMRINELGIVTIPGEMFVEFGLEIKSRSKFDKTFVFGLSNGQTPGYIVTKKAVEEGGYEAWATRLKPEAGIIIRDAALELLERVHG